MTRKRASIGTFVALGIVAGWLFSYILLHEAFTASFRNDKRDHLQATELSADIRSCLARERHDWLENIYADGAAIFGKCSICHHAKDFGQPRFGPAIYNILGQPVARLQSGSDSDYRYSRSLLEMHDRGMTWSLPALWSFIHKPAQFASGTRMPFPGLDDPKAIRSLIHYLAWSPATDCEKAEIVHLDVEALTKLTTNSLSRAVCLEPPTTSIGEHGEDGLRSNPGIFLIPPGSDSYCSPDAVSDAPD